MDFSVILQDAKVRGLVQEGMLERAFHDALFPQQIFRSEVTPKPWPAGVGDSMIFSAPGLIPPNARPMQPGVDPTPKSYAVEQWEAMLQQYGDSIDSHMPTSMVAVVDLFMRNSHQLGLQAGQSLNRAVRDRMYNAGESGWTVADGGAAGTTSLRVRSLNGFTRARNPTTAGASKVRFSTVSATNPLSIKLYDNGAEVSNTVVGYTPDNVGDETGPGVLTLGSAVTNVANRAYVKANDSTWIYRAGGGNKVDDVGSSDLPTLSGIRSVVARLWQQNVPVYEDGRFHVHCDPVSIAKMFEDSDLQRLNTSLPDYYMYRQFAVGELLGCVFVRNNECPVPETVVTANNDGVTFSLDDPFAGDLYNNGNASTGVKVHRMLFSGRDAIFEYHSDYSALITEVGIAGKVSEASVSNNGIDVFSDRIQMIVRQPMNRMQDMVSTSWRFIGDWPVRTDAATGDGARYKRFAILQHGE
jgi:hypothetical protein